MPLMDKKLLIIPKTLLYPGVAPHMVTAVIPLLPKTGPIFFHKLDSPHPFGAFPSIEPRDHETQRVTVVRLQILAVMLPGKQAILTQKVVQRQVGREALFAMNQDEFRPWVRQSVAENFP